MNFFENNKFYNENKSVFKEAVDKTDIDFQVDMLLEEMSELQKELLKERRHGTTEEALHKIYNEIADVQLTLYETIFIFDGEEKVSERMQFKIDRLKERMRSNQSEL